MNTFAWGFKATMGAATAGCLIMLGLCVAAGILYYVFLRDK